MNRQIFTGGQPNYQLRHRENLQEFFCIFGLLLGALIIYTVGSGNLPLRDWDEGTIARVAKEIWQAPPDSLRWLFPTLWGDPYLNKPPLIHDLIALSYHFGGLNERSARLPGAVLTSLSVPLLYLLGREVFKTRLPALLSALVYLTLFPVLRHGRLAMLDGAVLCFSIGMFFCVCRSRRDLRWSLGAGFGFALLCLTKGIVGVLMAFISFAFLFWDTPRLLTSPYFWSGWVLGSTPALAWYGAQFFHYEQEFFDSVFAQQIKRIGDDLDNHRGPLWYYILEILKYSWPWLIFTIWGYSLARFELLYSWAKLVIVWGGGYLLVVSLMATKLPWYILPIYPALALAAGYALSMVRDLPIERPYPRIWAVPLGIFAFAAGSLALAIHLDWTGNLIGDVHPLGVLALAALSLTFGTTTILIGRRSLQFMPILFWGMYVSLFLFVISPYWIWELNESFAVKPVARMIRQYVPEDRRAGIYFDYERPSLNFYSDRRVFPLTGDRLQEYWRNEPEPYLSILEKEYRELDLKDAIEVARTPNGWLLLSKEK